MHVLEDTHTGNSPTKSVDTMYVWPCMGIEKQSKQK